MKTKTPIHVSDIPQKVYQDGTIGDYFCQCKKCKGYFLGSKLDTKCDKCERKQKIKELKHRSVKILAYRLGMLS